MNTSKRGSPVIGPGCSELVGGLGSDVGEDDGPVPFSDEAPAGVGDGLFGFFAGGLCPVLNLFDYAGLARVAVDVDGEIGTDPYSAEVYAKGAENLRKLIADGILIRDMHYRYIDANPRLLAMLGYTLDEFLRIGTKDLIHPEDLATVHGFWYGIGMELQSGLKITIKQEPVGPFVVKPVRLILEQGLTESVDAA